MLLFSLHFLSVNDFFVTENSVAWILLVLASLYAKTLEKKTCLRDGSVCYFLTSFKLWIVFLHFLSNSGESRTDRQIAGLKRKPTNQILYWILFLCRERMENSNLRVLLKLTERLPAKKQCLLKRSYGHGDCIALREIYRHPLCQVLGSGFFPCLQHPCGVKFCEFCINIYHVSF